MDTSDCDDTDDTINPDGVEVSCNDKDDDCNGSNGRWGWRDLVC